MKDHYNLYSPFVLVIAIASAIFMISPVIFIILYAFNPTEYFTWPMKGLSIKWFQNFFENENFYNAFIVSIKMTLVVTPISLLISLPTAYGLVRCKFKGRELVNALIMSPLIIPGVVTGIAFLILLSALGMGPGFVGLVIGMTCISVPFGVRALVANMHGLKPELEEVAYNLGASKWSVFWNIILPQLRPGLLAGGTFIFVEAIDNFSVSVFLTSTETTTLPVASYSYIRDFDDPTIAASAVILILISTALVFLCCKLVGLDRMFRIE